MDMSFSCFKLPSTNKLRNIYVTHNQVRLSGVNSWGSCDPRLSGRKKTVEMVVSLSEHKDPKLTLKEWIPDGLGQFNTGLS